MVEVSFGEWLSRRRKALGLTQHDLADRVNCAVITIRKIEAEQRRPSLQIAERLAQILAVPAGEQQTFLRFARSDWYSTPSMEMVQLPWKPIASNTYVQVQPPYTTLVGREKELAELTSILKSSEKRLVTIVGAPGVGKSRLASEIIQTIGSEFPGGMFSIPISEIDNNNRPGSVLLQSLRTGSADRLLIFAELTNERFLTLIDDAENHLEHLRSLVYNLLQNCPQLKILVTSREPLHLVGEEIFYLTPLGIPSDLENHLMEIEYAGQFSALNLFVHSAREYQPGFSITNENVDDLISITKHLDGLPLAIELLASRMRLMTPQTLLAHLSNQFILQSTGPVYLPGNQKTLQKAIDRSYLALSLDEKRLFTYLSIFEGNFTLEMVEAAFSATPAHNVIADLLSSLLEKSLVQQAATSQAEPHFKFLMVIRRYAAEHLKDFEQDALAAWHFPPDMVRHASRPRVDIQLQKKFG